ncbi:MAG: hypothetical protein DMG14_21620 [Acidobacteria bacterium]|nr:MAG: hypothetical protein DMG14_21620 [Acidobacteriota bacterium]
MEMRDRFARSSCLRTAFGSGFISFICRCGREGRHRGNEHLRRAIERLYRRGEWQRRRFSRLRQRWRYGHPHRERLDVGELQEGRRSDGHALQEQRGTFVDVTREAGLLKRGWGMGVCAGDYDNNGYTDFYVTAYGPNVLFHNNGNGSFTEVTAAAGVGDTHWSTNCAFGDYDRDGRLDLYVANYMAFDEKSTPRRGKDSKCRFLGVDVFCGPQGLQGEPDVLFHNNGNGTFTDATRAAGIKDPNYYGFGVIFSDFDNDGWPDIYVANDGNPNFLFPNNGNGTFTEVGVLSGTALNEAGRAQSGMGVAVGDYDANGLFDIFVTNFAGDTNTLYQNMGKLLFADTTSIAGLGEISLQYLGWGAGFEDFDNDGLPDIFVANGHVYPQVDTLDAGQHYAQRKEIYRNLDGGKFRELARDLGGDVLIPKSSRGAAFGDLSI